MVRKYNVHIMCHRAKFHKNRLNRGQDMVILYIFQDGGHQHLGFSKFQFFKGQNGQEGGTASQCQILSKSLQPWPKYRDFSILQDGGCRHLGFSKLKFLEGQIASLCQISSKSLELRPRYDFSIFKMAAAAILDFPNLKFLTFGPVKRVEMRNHAKFCRNRSNGGRNIAIFRIFKMADAAMLDF